MIEEIGTYDLIYQNYLDAVNEKIFFEKRKKLGHVVFQIKSAYKDGIIENIEELPESYSDVLSLDERGVYNLEKILSENYFPD